MTFQVGPFTLEERIGVGGGGEVWRGVHRRQSVPVAVKLITGDRASDPTYQEAFRREVEAVAGLDHPGVVQVLDTGMVTAAEAGRSGGVLTEGGPYLAMELAQGSLRRHRVPASFDELRLWLLWLLEILAHAHARGVVHRDLKPGNVLWFDEPAVADDAGGASRLRLADFGLALALGNAHVARNTAGTPTHMAPEQFRGQWRDFGPATDLYALGCMAYTLAAGHPPFRSSDITDLMAAHLGTPPPPLRPRFPVPTGFEAWLRRCLQKSPLLRFQRAADAATSLHSLDTTEGMMPVFPTELGEEETEIDATLSASATSMERTSRTEGRAPSFVNLDTVAFFGPASPRQAPPIPETPQDPSMAPSLEIVGAGLGLYGLRALPLVGRDTERHTLWDALRTVGREASPRVVVLRGPAGTGKSRLADWIIQRAHATGAAYTAKARHDPGGAPYHGLDRLLDATLVTSGLQGDAVAARLTNWGKPRGLESTELGTLTELFSGTAGEQRAPTAAERLSLTLRVLQAAAEAELDQPEVRPLAIWLDDVQWGGDALRLVQWALDHPVPALFVLTVQDEALIGRPEEAELLAALERDPRVRTLHVGPLDTSDSNMLVQRLLLLEGELARQVEQRTQGIPLFAVQLVGDWVRRGVLEMGKTGFVLRQGAAADVPDGIHEMWVDRIERAAGKSLEPLQIAAVLGTTVDRTEWSAAVRVAGLELPGELETRLQTEGLSVPTPQGFAYVHGMLRESLERSARDDGSLERWHLAVANALQIRWEAQRSRGLVERVGGHFINAGRPDLALQPLLDAALERRGTSDYQGALAVLDRRAAAMDALGVGAEDPRRGQEWVARADVLICMGRLEQAEAEANKVVRVGRQRHWENLIAPALRHAAVTMGKRGRFEAASRRLARAVDAARFDSDPLEWARCILYQGDVARLQGSHEIAVGHYHDALRRFEAEGDLRGSGLAMLGLGGVQASLGQPDRAERHLLSAIDRFERRGARFAVASARIALGDVHRSCRRYDAAREAYQQAEKGLIAVGSVERVVVQLDLGLLELHRGDLLAAMQNLITIEPILAHSGRPTLIAICLAALLACDPSHDGRLRMLDRLIHSHVIVDTDILQCLQRAVHRATGPHRQQLQKLVDEQQHRLGKGWALGINTWIDFPGAG